MKHYLLILGVILLASCKSYVPPQNYNFSNEQEFNQTYDEVWTKIISLFSEYGVPIKTIDKASGLIATDYNLGAESLSSIMDCGTPAEDLNIYKFENQTANFNIQVVRLSDQKTKVKVKTFFKSLYVRYSSQNGRWVRTGSQWLNCNSTGAFENSIFNYISN